MAAPSEGFWQRRGALGLYELILTWWRHRISFLISVAITLAAMTLYYFTFFGERTTPIFNFIQRLEFDSLDTRFRYRPRSATPVDPRIVIVDIDQHSQEVLGKWPFSRTHFARLLDVLHDDGAKVVAFDVTFSKPDQSAAPIRALWAEMEARKKRGEPVDPALSTEVQKLAAQYDADKQFASAIQRFGAVVLGNFFLHTEADLRGLYDKTLDTYANQIAFYSFPSVRPLRPETGKQDRINLMQKFQPDNLLPKGAEANLELLTNALSEEASSTGFFNVYPDVDGVVRQANLIIPYGRSKDFSDWDIYASLDVQTVRSYFRLPNEQVVLEYGPVGAYQILFGPSARVRTDELGRVLINFHGPGYTYPHKSLADVVERKISPDVFSGKIVLVGATATGIGDLRTTPYGGLDYPGVEIHANVIDCILHQSFLYRGAKQTLADVLLILFFGIPLGIWMALVSPRWMWFGAFLIVPLVWRVPDRAPGSRRLFCISARLVAQLWRAGNYAEWQCASRLTLSSTVRRKGKAQSSLRVWTISQSGSDSPLVGESKSRRTKENRDHRYVQRHSRLYHHFRKARRSRSGALPQPISVGYDQPRLRALWHARQIHW